MKAISGSAWRHQGSTLVTSLEAGAGLLADAQKPNPSVRVVSLRAALRWTADGWPPELPGVTCVVISGLEAVIDRCASGTEAAEFLRSTVKPIIRASQEHWTATGLAFLFPVNPAKITPDIDDRVVYTLPSGDTVAVSHALWNGAARDLREVHTVANQPLPLGYHVSRIS